MSIIKALAIPRIIPIIAPLNVFPGPKIGLPSKKNVLPKSSAVFPPKSIAVEFATYIGVSIKIRVIINSLN